MFLAIDDEDDYGRGEGLGTVRARLGQVFFVFLTEDHTFSTILKKSCKMLILMQVARVPKILLNFKPIRELSDNFNSNGVLGIFMIYYIYKFQEK